MSSLPSPVPTGNGSDPAHCPLCGGPNECQRCTLQTYKGSCWCERVTFPEELWERLPAEARGRACICPSCVLQALRRRPVPRPGPGDFYLEPGTGWIVFTEAYHRKRGYCCGSGCRHCPWKEEPVFPASSIRLAGAVVLFVAGSLLGVPLQAAGWSEDFAADPLRNGWQAFGSVERFHWNETSQTLDVEWNTDGPHSFFTRSLGTTLNATDPFSLTFDLYLSEAVGGVREGRPGAMQVAVGLLDLARATRQSYLRGAGRAFDLIEFNWFPEGFIPGFGRVEPTLSAIAFDETGRVAADFDFPFLLTLDTWHRIELAHDPADRSITLRVQEGDVTRSTRVLSLPATFGEFHLDALAILVWDERTSFGDSLQARGSVDNIRVVVPDPPIGEIRLQAGGREVEFESREGWHYQLEASGELWDWHPTGSSASGTGGVLRLADTREAEFPQQFYRVRAEPLSDVSATRRTGGPPP